MEEWDEEEEEEEEEERDGEDDEEENGTVANVAATLFTDAAIGEQSEGVC